MNDPDTQDAPGKMWKHVAVMTLWLCLAPPVGFWKLWKDPVLSTSAKWRVLVYCFLLPFLLYAVYGLNRVNSALQRLTP